MCIILFQKEREQGGKKGEEKTVHVTNDKLKDHPNNYNICSYNVVSEFHSFSDENLR